MPAFQVFTYVLLFYAEKYQEKKNYPCLLQDMARIARTQADLQTEFRARYFHNSLQSSVLYDAGIDNAK